jgi:hypothetical protein
MNGSPFDVLARHAGAVRDRRATLQALGAAALGAATAPRAATAKPKAGKKARKKCKKQVGQCRAVFAECCGDEQECLDAAFACCQNLGTCHAGAFIECAFGRT